MSANEREKQRFNLAMVAIRLFHGEVGDDLVLKADQFKPLRDKLLRGAADFYGKLEELLKGQADRASRAAMGNAYFSLGDLTSKIGDKPAALAAHRNGLAVRRELAAALADDAEARSDVAKSLSSTAALLHQTGESAEALARFEGRVTCSEGIPHSGAGSDARRSLLVQANLGIGYVLAEIGKTDAAMAANQRSLELLTRLADENPANIEFRDLMAANHNNIGALLMSLSKTHEASRVVSTGACHQSETRQRKPRRHRVPRQPGDQPEQHRLPVFAERQTGRGAGIVPASTFDPAEAGRREPCRHRPAKPPGEYPQQHWNLAKRCGETGQSARVLAAGASDPAETRRRQPRRHRLPAVRGGQP